MPLIVINQEKEDSEKQVNNYIKIILQSLVLLLSSISFSQIGNVKTYTIDNISVRGTEHLSPKTLIAVSGLKIGDEITVPGTQITNAVKNIWSENIVSNVSIVVSEVNGDLIGLEIKVVEHQRLSKVDITGIPKRQRKEITESVKLAKSQVLSEALKKNIRFKIENFYKEKGFYGIEVTQPTLTADTSIKNHMILTYNVNKGPKYKIQEIEINGNQNVKEKIILRKMKKTKERRFYRFWGRSKFLAKEFKTDKEKVIDYYHSLGMRDVTFDLDTLYPIDDKNLKLKIDIVEGPVYHFGDITWVGNSKYTDKQLSKVLGVKKGDVYNKAELDSKLNFNPNGVDISSMYLDDGYLFFSVNPVEVRTDSNIVDIEFRIFEGQQATIGEVRVFGNTKTSDHVIIRELYTLPGNKFSRSDLIQSQQIIARLGYFDPEQIGINPIPNPQDGTVDIEYTVVEKPSDQLQLSGGWGGGSLRNNTSGQQNGVGGFVGTLGVTFNNFSTRNILKPRLWDPLPSGDGQRLSIQASSSGAFFQNYGFSFTEPWLGGKKPNSFSISANHSVYGQFNATSTGKMRISGLTVSLGRRLRSIDNFLTLSNGISYNHYDIDNFRAFSNEKFCSDCEANNLNFITTLSRSTSGPNIQFPTKGSDLSLSFTITPPYSLLDRSLEKLPNPTNFRLVEYNKWMFDYSNFLKLTSRRRQEAEGKPKKERPLVLHTRFHFGVLGSLNKNLPLSPFERFNMGGTGIQNFGFILGTEIISLRGYEDRTLFPGDFGGVIYNKAVMELRYPIVTEGVATIYGFGFLEAGNNWASHKEFNPFDLKKATGLGASLFMNGIGNISFGWGWGLDNTAPIDDGSGNFTKSNGGRFIFAIGQTIR